MTFSHFSISQHISN